VKARELLNSVLHPETDCRASRLAHGRLTEMAGEMRVWNSCYTQRRSLRQQTSRIPVAEIAYDYLVALLSYGAACEVLETN
jgi:hypothetical protein